MRGDGVPPVPPALSAGLNDDGEPMSERALALERELQQLVSEQADGVAEMIEKTVELHRKIKEDVTQMLKQDEEEEALVREVVIRTENAEKELMRNPGYESFRARAHGEEVGPRAATAAGRLADWPEAAPFTKHASAARVRLSPDEIRAVLRLIRGNDEEDDDTASVAINRIVKILRCTEPHYLCAEGAPLHDIAQATGRDARVVLGCAAALIRARRDHGDQTPVTTTEVHLAHQSLRAVQAHLPLETSAEDAAAAVLRSAELRRVLTEKATQGLPLHVTAIPFRGLLHMRPLRLLVVRGAVRVVEQDVVASINTAGREAVEAFGKEVLCAPAALAAIGQSFAADITFDTATLETRIDWIHPLTPDIPRLFTWEELCSMAAAQSCCAEWRSGPVSNEDDGTTSNAAGGSRAWLALLLEEQNRLRPGSSTWEGSAPEGVLRAITKPSADTMTTEAASELPQTSVSCGPGSGTLKNTNSLGAIICASAAAGAGLSFCVARLAAR